MSYIHIWGSFERKLPIPIRTYEFKCLKTAEADFQLKIQFDKNNTDLTLVAV